MSRVVLRAGIWLAAGVALGRLAGFVREAILAAQFGRSAEGDAAVLLLTLPDTIINLLVGSAMLAMISDIAGASGGGYSFALPLFGVLALWSANPRGLLVYLGLNGISVLFDIIFMSVQAAGGVGGARPDAAIGACAPRAACACAVVAARTDNKQTAPATTTAHLFSRSLPPYLFPARRSLHGD